MESMVNFWKDKKVLITGHTGFKGSWLTLWLQQLNAQVIGVALEPPTTPNLFEAAHVAMDIVDIRCDINDYTKLAAIFMDQQPDIVFHLAAQPLVRHSYTDPIQTYATNVMGTVHVLEAARQCASIRAIVNVTSDKCYENKEWLWGYRENEPMGGVDPYSSSKACAELVTAAYRHSYFASTNLIGLASARAGNVIGGGDWSPDRLIPDVISACVQQQPVRLRYPHAIRPWQHVLESVAGYLCLAEHLYRQPAEYSEAWNFGPFDSDTKTVAWIVDALLNQWGEGLNWELIQASKAHEAQYLKLDCSKAITRLNWRPKWDIQTAVTATVDWYKAYYQAEDMRALTLKQIEDYSNFLFKS